MQPTRLTVALFAAGLLPLLAGIGFALLGWDATPIHLLVFGLDLGLLVLFLADALLGSQRRGLHITREKPARLSVGVDNEVTLLVENRGGGRLDMLLRDETPPGFRVEPPQLAASVPVRGWIRLAYRLLPTERGNF